MRRENSATRRAFATAAHGAHASLAEATLAQGNTGTKKLGRMLGPAGDLHPSWEVLDAIAAHDADTVLRTLAEAWGFAVERLPEPEAVSLERMATEVRQLREVAEQLELRLDAATRQRIGPKRVGERKRGAA